MLAAPTSSTSTSTTTSATTATLDVIPMFADTNSAFKKTKSNSVSNTAGKPDMSSHKNINNDVHYTFEKNNVFENYQHPMFNSSYSYFGAPSLFTANPVNDKLNYNEDFFSFGKQSVNDIESSSSRTPSPKNESYGSFQATAVDHTSPYYSYHYPCQKKDPASKKLNQHFYHDVSSPYSDINTQHETTMEALKQQLEKSTKTIQNLVQELRSTIIDNEKKNTTILFLQNSLKAKEAEIKEQENKILAVTQFYKAQTDKLKETLAINHAYRAFFRSKGFNTLELDSGAMESIDNSFAKLRNAPSSNYINNNNFHCHSEHTVKNEVSLPVIENDNKKIVDYRRLYDKQTHIQWSALVDRIIQDTDQQASIFMQQKLKSSSSDHKSLIFKAVIDQAFTLMTSRFGNFLVQRVFELGTPEQTQQLSEEMKGRVLTLTCDPFGCHVVQKALEYVDEDTKAILVSELFVNISETVVHKHACHVWQKVFEIRWSKTPPPMMKHMHEALNGKWSRVALDETGSLVIQNIFENLSESDKRPIINEILTNAVLVAKGQWGNWVIQHILEHAEKTSDREVAFDIVIKEAVQLSMDQFASKVVEKALRIGGPSFLSRFIQRICHSDHSDRLRMALVDIASDQYGNYVAQWLINNVNEEQKISICRLIKRHMVSLRGSKYGQRVAILVEKVLQKSYNNY